MKRALFVCVFFVRCLHSFAQSGDALLIPKEVFVADSAEIRYAFSADACALAAPSAELDAVLLSKELGAGEAFTLSRVRLTKLPGASYSLSLFIVPWKTGLIDLPPFNVNAFLPGKTESACLIDVPPVFINSVSERTGRSQLAPPVPPVLVPGTTYAVYALVFLCLLFISLIIAVLARARRIAGFLRLRAARARVLKSGRSALRDLKRLAKTDEGDLARCAEQVQLILRRYLGVFFGSSFLSVSTPELVPFIRELVGEAADLLPEGPLESLDGLFIRCDYLRFDAQFRIRAQVDARHERLELIQTARDCVHAFETGRQ